MDADLQKAAYWYQRSASQGHKEAQCQMGRFHVGGLGGCDQSDATAEEFYTLAAASNYPLAQSMLATLMNKNGRYAEALQWATLAAAQGSCTNGIAERVLASLYIADGAEEITKSPARALYWAKKAAMAGRKDAFYCVAKLIMGFNRELFGVAEVGECCEPSFAKVFCRAAS